MDLDDLAYVGPEVWLLGALAAIICSVLVTAIWTAWQLPRVQKVRWQMNQQASPAKVCSSQQSP